MKKKILIITSDPESINYEILKKSLFFFKKKNKNKYIFIGSKKLFYNNIKLPKNNNFDFIDIKYDNKKNIKTYLQNSFEKAFEIIDKKNADGIINLPLNKKNFFNYNYPGVTEYISSKFDCEKKTTMLLFSDKFSVSPITTHYKITKIVKNLNKEKIIQNFYNIKFFYQKIIGIKNPKIGLLGLNPHNGIDFKRPQEEDLFIKPALNKLKKNKNNKIFGLLSPDSSFLEIKRKNLNSLIGHYHDQVLTTFKYINEFNAINITLGLPFLRVSPDHGTGLNILGKNKANPDSFIYALNFYEKYSDNL